MIEHVYDDGGRAAAGYRGDTHDCSRDGTRCVYGHWKLPPGGNTVKPS
jgi:hypothetical protein